MHSEWTPKFCCGGCYSWKFEGKQRPSKLQHRWDWLEYWEESRRLEDTSSPSDSSKRPSDNAEMKIKSLGICAISMKNTQNYYISLSRYRIDRLFATSAYFRGPRNWIESIKTTKFLTFGTNWFWHFPFVRWTALAKLLVSILYNKQFWTWFYCY